MNRSPTKEMATGRIEHIENCLYAIENFVCSLALLAMLFCIALGVCIRFFGWSLPNIAEYAIVAMSPLTFVGAAMCSRVHGHISVDIIEQIHSEKIRQSARVLVTLLTLIFAVAYAWLSWTLLIDTLRTGERLLDMGTPLYIPTFLFFSGMLMMAAHLTLNLVRCFHRNQATTLMTRKAQ